MVIKSRIVERKNLELCSKKIKKSTNHIAIRLQFSVYEVRNTKRIVDNLIIKVESLAKHLSKDYSIMIMHVLLLNMIMRLGCGQYVM